MRNKDVIIVVLQTPFIVSKKIIRLTI